jgi:hypothetical protein
LEALWKTTLRIVGTDGDFMTSAFEKIGVPRARRRSAQSLMEATGGGSKVTAATLQADLYRRINAGIQNP